MKTSLSKNGIEVICPCTVHLFDNGPVMECDYQSNEAGKDLMDYICNSVGLEDADYFGLRFVDKYEQRHWLDMYRPIRTQIKNVSHLNLEFKVRVYPPKPYKLTDTEAKNFIFMQLRSDLKSGRLSCGPADSPILIGLILQYSFGDYDPEVHTGNYVKDVIALHQSYSAEMKAIDFHKNHLKSLTQQQAQELFLRLVCQLETYGVDPYLVEDINKDQVTLWINHKGMVTYKDIHTVDNIKWLTIQQITREDSKLSLHLLTKDVVTYSCLTKGECDYIYHSAVSHLVYFADKPPVSDITDTDKDSDEFMDPDKKPDSKTKNKKKEQSTFYNYYIFFIIRFILLYALLVYGGYIVFDLFYDDVFKILKKLLKADEPFSNFAVLGN